MAPQNPNIHPSLEHYQFSTKWFCCCKKSMTPNPDLIKMYDGLNLSSGLTQNEKLGLPGMKSKSMIISPFQRFHSMHSYKWLQLQYQGPLLNMKMFFSGTGNSIIKIRWSWHCLIFIKGYCLMVRQHLYIETDPTMVMSWHENSFHITD